MAGNLPRPPGFVAGTFNKLSCRILHTGDTPQLHGVNRYYANLASVRSAHVLVAVHGAGEWAGAHGCISVSACLHVGLHVGLPWRMNSHKPALGALCLQLAGAANCFFLQEDNGATALIEIRPCECLQGKRYMRIWDVCKDVWDLPVYGIFPTLQVALAQRTVAGQTLT